VKFDLFRINYILSYVRLALFNLDFKHIYLTEAIKSHFVHVDILIDRIFKIRSIFNDFFNIGASIV
jgi:hypothetical protein